jgi:hypothetical protein
MTDQPDDWLAAEHEHRLAAVLGTRGPWGVIRWNYLMQALAMAIQGPLARIPSLPASR